MVKQRQIAILALCASFFALCVIGLGAFTRLIDAGLGCPDWPGCYGQWVAPISQQANDSLSTQYPHSHFIAYKAWAEMIHRYFAGTLSILIMIIVIMIVTRSIKNMKTEKMNVICAVGIVLAVIYQIILGQLTVTLKLLPMIVTQHLLGGFTILSILWLIYLNNRSIDLTSMQSPIRGITKYFILSLWGLFLLLLQITLGAWTSTHYAALSCPDFPFCFNDHPMMAMHFKQAFHVFTPIGVNYEGGVLPESIRQTIQITHRLGALLIVLYWMMLTVFAVRKFKQMWYLMKSIYIIWGLLILQLCIGMVNVIFKLPLVTAVSHNLVAALLLLAVLTLTYKLGIFSKKGMRT